jgi:hypothetical protein
MEIPHVDTLVKANISQDELQSLREYLSTLWYTGLYELNLGENFIPFYNPQLN